MEYIECIYKNVIYLHIYMGYIEYILLLSNFQNDVLLYAIKFMHLYSDDLDT